jgi:hypothetical protein
LNKMVTEPEWSRCGFPSPPQISCQYKTFALQIVV